ncbi:hca operon transcriptional activator [Lederbergia lenta]|uniref:Hca operon transcriptional activator n=1 Tax=Lederbergia lenta TaxID=1467 RepID=A0A2X4WM36_LEDLE|nr:hca operon transcriptional activator [Lederbergia lenta]
MVHKANGKTTTDIFAFLVSNFPAKAFPIASKYIIQAMDLLNVPLICSRHAIKQTFSKNHFADRFGESFDKLNVVTTYNLAYNAAIIVERALAMQ